MTWWVTGGLIIAAVIIFYATIIMHDYNAERQRRNKELRKNKREQMRREFRDGPATVEFFGDTDLVGKDGK